jgi:hypothetical protein
MWVQHPAVRIAIEELEAELHSVTQRRMAALFPLSVRAMTRLLRDDDARVVLRAVEMVWIALGRLPPKGAHVTLCNHNHLAIGTPHCLHPGSLGLGQQLDREDVQEAMRMLQAERERIEREKVQMPEQARSAPGVTARS